MIYGGVRPPFPPSSSASCEMNAEREFRDSRVNALISFDVSELMLMKLYI